MNKNLGTRILALRERIVSHFNTGDWEEIGLLTGHTNEINGHARLLRSLFFGDEDYAGSVLAVLKNIAIKDVAALDQFDSFLDEKYAEESHFISAKPSTKKLTFAPHVFEVQDIALEEDLVAVMMPFIADFQGVFDAIKKACKTADFRCMRVDGIWEESTIIQDIFNLLIRARIVVVDFSGRNPNVMYETGIAHTLGKLVIPISQSLDDVPFDMKHHRVLKYLPNTEGYAALRSSLQTKFAQLTA
ncbi:MAG: hypothetical protein K8S99_17825 [Planctomycetes bacterium]|nr:hypothetical protein [Planctomycetota bacterium]